MSLACFRIASIRIRFTSFTTGACSAASSSEDMSISSVAWIRSTSTSSLSDSEHVVERFVFVHIVAYEVADDVIAGDVHLDVFSGEKADVVYDEKVARVRHGHVQSIAHKRRRGRPGILHDIVGNEAQDFFRYIYFGYVYLGAVKLLGYKLQKNVFIDYVELYQGRPNAFARLTLLVKRAV